MLSTINKLVKRENKRNKPERGRSELKNQKLENQKHENLKGKKNENLNLKKKNLIAHACINLKIESTRSR